jgi:hypothetical protein
MAYKQLDLLLGELESTIGTEQTGLTATNFLQVADGFSLDTTTEMTAMAFATGQFDQHRSVPGTVSAEAKITTYLDTLGPAIADSFQEYFQCCGMQATVGISAAYPNIYSPTSDYIDNWKSMTLNKYTGANGTNQSFLTRAVGCMFTAVIKGEIGKPISAEFTGKGAVPATPAMATYPTGPFTQLSDVIPAVMKASNVSIMGKAYSVLSFELDLGNKVELIKDMTTPFGFARADITDRKSKIKVKIFEKPYIVGTDENPFDFLHNGDLTDFSVTINTSAYPLSIRTSYFGTGNLQITALKPGNENGINTLEIDGIIIGNNWALLIDDPASDVDPDEPVLTNPGNEATAVSRTAVTFTWSPEVSAQSYNLEVSLGTDTGFATPIISLTGLTSASEAITFSTELAANTRYIWRVKAVNNSGASAWSGSYNFTTGS